jgi:hypothetical protein
MYTKKYLLIVAFMVALVALVGLGADVAEAGAINKIAPTHPPKCVKIYSTDRADNYIELQCTDSGKDIAGVQVVAGSGVKYTLNWDATSVALRVYPDPKADKILLSWTVSDTAGSRVTGILP